jgi:hypothetical protein
MVRIFPHEIVCTVANLAELHALSEGLDTAMGRVIAAPGLNASQYGQAWRGVGRAPDRERQIALMLAVGPTLTPLQIETILTTTAIDIDEELMNRCLVLTVDESREQTRAIHALQRRRQTLEGLLAETDRTAIMALHRNAQMLLEPVHVVNPFADALTFLDDRARTRRDHMKYLTLIRSVALLHQHQRTIKSVTHRGTVLRYIEVIESDIALANTLAHEVLGRTLDELPPQTRRLLDHIHSWAGEECERLAVRRADLRFTRRRIRALTGWGDTQLKVHLSRLADLEYVLVHRAKAGQGHEYELLYDGEGGHGERFVMGLSGPGIEAQDAAHDGDETCTYDAARSGPNGARSAPGRGSVGGRSVGGRRDEAAAKPRPERGCEDDPTGAAETPLLRPNGSAASYPQTVPAA